jgi:cytochrome P450
MNFIIAGRDTTANLLTWLLFELVSHPEVIQVRLMGRISKRCESITIGHTAQ